MIMSPKEVAVVVMISLAEIIRCSYLMMHVKFLRMGLQCNRATWETGKMGRTILEVLYGLTARLGTHPNSPIANGA